MHNWSANNLPSIYYYEKHVIRNGLREMGNFKEKYERQMRHTEQNTNGKFTHQHRSWLIFCIHLSIRNKLRIGDELIIPFFTLFNHNFPRQTKGHSFPSPLCVSQYIPAVLRLLKYILTSLLAFLLYFIISHFASQDYKSYTRNDFIKSHVVPSY